MWIIASKWTYQAWIHKSGIYWEIGLPVSNSNGSMFFTGMYGPMCLQLDTKWAKKPPKLAQCICMHHLQTRGCNIDLWIIDSEWTSQVCLWKDVASCKQFNWIRALFSLQSQTYLTDSLRQSKHETYPKLAISNCQNKAMIERTTGSKPSQTWCIYLRFLPCIFCYPYSWTLMTRCSCTCSLKSSTISLLLRNFVLLLKHLHWVFWLNVNMIFLVQSHPFWSF